MVGNQDMIDTRYVNWQPSMVEVSFWQQDPPISFHVAEFRSMGTDPTNGGFSFTAARFQIPRQK